MIERMNPKYQNIARSERHEHTSMERDKYKSILICLESKTNQELGVNMKPVVIVSV